jgi:hypothetical protein
MTRKLDALLAGVGVLFGAASLTWPFGWDTSVHYYVGREWLLRGAIPYRDTFDHKTPGIHLVHTIAIALFGEGMWGIRLIELGSVVVLGWACAQIARDRAARPAPGLAGATILAASVYYYGFYDYWNTAQCELLAATCATLMVLAALRTRSPVRAGAAVGLLAGVTLLLKPPFVLFALVAIAVLSMRRRGHVAQLARVLGALALSATIVPGLVLAYFAAHGALDDLIEIVGYANAAYLENEQRLHSLGEVVDNAVVVWRGYSPVAGLLFVSSAAAIAVACVRRSRGLLVRWAIAAAMLAIGYLIIALQLKFYYYHWITELPAGTLMTANVIVAASRARVVGARSRLWVPALPSLALLAAFALTGAQAAAWLRTTVAAVRWLDGDWDRARFASTFQTWDGVRRYEDVEATGTWIREHSAAGDELLVRGVAAEIYVVSGLHAPGRFFWTAFLTRPSRRFHREAWLAEDAAVIDSRRARWVVTWTQTTDGPESTSYFLPRGYVERTRIGAYSVLERAGGNAPAARR